jgi:hypothetical protein
MSMKNHGRFRRKLPPSLTSLIRLALLGLAAKKDSAAQQRVVDSRNESYGMSGRFIRS